MSNFNDHDWELINAYADGELPADKEREVSELVRSDSIWAKALDDVRTTKSAMTLLKPEPAAVPRQKRRFGMRRAAIAAALVAVVVSIGLVLPGNVGDDWRDVPINLHQNMSSNTYVLPETDNLPVISTARAMTISAFDLSASRLTLVDVWTGRRDGREAIAMHYRGQNGCRLTIIALETGSSDPALLPARHDGLGARWSLPDFHFYVLASGMDRSRFDAIAAFAKAESLRLTRQDDLQMAMRDTTNQAQPCA